MNDMYTELYEKLSRLQWLLQRNYMVNHAVLGPFADTTRGQGRVMAALKMQSEISTKDLSYLLGITIPSLNELLNKLEKGGYVVRIPSEADKRVMIIQLTDKGKEAQPAQKDYSDIFDCLSEDEQTVFGDYLDRVIGALETQVGHVPDEKAMHQWMRGARNRMGSERFEDFMKQGFGGAGHGPRGHHGPHGPGLRRHQGHHGPHDILEEAPGARGSHAPHEEGHSPHGPYNPHENMHGPHGHHSPHCAMANGHQAPFDQEPEEMAEVTEVTEVTELQDENNNQ